MSAPEPAENAPGSPAPPDVPAMTPVQDGLPHDEPLTPELLEDEAIRGDFMLRWAVVLLALLLGCTEVGDTQTLVHVKTGEYLLSHGVLPPRTDVFSSTAADRPWVNLSWLFDIALAGAYALGAATGLGGAVGLTVFKALLSAVAFWFLVNSGVKGVSTWWTSVCAAMALLVAHFQFAALPDLVTLLGLAALLWLIQRWHNGDSRTLWGVPVLFLLWSNLDPRMWVGLAMLLLFLAGEVLGRWLGRSMFERDEQRKHLAVVFAASCVAALINPFGWQSLTAPATLYGVEDPAIREVYGIPATETAGRLSYMQLKHHSMVDAAFWRLPNLNHSSIGVLVLAAAAAVAIGLNHRRFAYSHVLMGLGAAALAAITVREIPPAAIVLAWVAGWNGQVWFRSNFRQAYSVDLMEVIFSRGGRAVTVLGLAALAWFAVTAWLPMPGAVRVGFGWQPILQTNIDGARSELEDMYDDRPFNFQLRQGDVFIWIGKRPFVDHRVALFKGPGDSDLMALHARTARALRPFNRDDPGSGDQSVWKKTLNDYHITHVVPSLALPGPDYLTTIGLLVDPGFQLVRMGNSSAVYYRRDRPPNYRHEGASQTLAEYLEAHPVDFTKLAFHAPEEDPKMPAIFREWPTPGRAYDSILMKARANEPAAIQEARHYHELLAFMSTGRYRLHPFVESAFCHLVIRKVNEGLVENPNHARGYRWLGTAYDSLDRLEAEQSAALRGTPLESRRFLQSVQAYGLSLLLEPDQIDVHLHLAERYAARKKWDLSLHHLSESERILERVRAEEAEKRTLREGELTLPRQYDNLRKSLVKSIGEVEAAIEAQRKEQKQPNALELAGLAYQRGCTLRAIDLLADDPAAERMPMAMLFKAILLIEAGRPIEAAGLYDRLEELIGKGQQAGEWRTYASLARLAQGSQKHAIELVKIDLENAELIGLRNVADALPLIVNPNGFPILNVLGAHAYLVQQPQKTSELRLHIALSQLEAGRRKEATETLRDIVAHSPETPHRPLVRFYLAGVSGEVIDPEPPSDWIPISKDLFAPEPREDEGKPPAEPPEPGENR